MIRQATEIDGILQKLSQIITTGWPSCKSSCAMELKQYWNIKEDIRHKWWRVVLQQPGDHPRIFANQKFTCITRGRATLE